MNDKTVIVEETGQGRYHQKIQVGDHVLQADEPIANGGDNKGPSPYDFLLAGLGACTSMTLRVYAELKKIPLEHITVYLKYNKIHANDCKDCENKNVLLDHIERTIELKGNLSEEQRNNLLDIANKCPVHRTLTSKISITTTLI